jgi:dihydrofolate reductase
MIIGGAEIFKLFIPLADKFYLSKVNASVKGDVYFPLWDQDNWQQISSEIYQKNETNEFSFDYQIWQRVKIR